MNRSPSASCGILVGVALCVGCAMTALSASSDVCGTWEPVPTPNVGNSVTRLTGVTALSANDAWSVGYWRDEPAGSGSLVIHWDGSEWSEVSLPGTSHLGTAPDTRGIDSAPNGDVWVAGSITTSYPTHNLPLLMRRRGGSWDFVETIGLRPQREYPFGDRGGFAYDVAVLDDDDAWAVGLAAGYGDASSSSVPMALHWDGSEWTDVEVPLVANRHHELQSVVMIASDDVWAVGDYRNIAGTFRGVTYHWDGDEWTHVPSPIEQISQSGLEDIDASGPNDVWAIGGGDSGVVLMHWDGSSWSLAEPPPNSASSLAVVGPDDVWAAGWDGYWHWDGSSWTEVPASVPGATYEIRSGGMDIVGECDIWSVGFWTLADGITSFTLAERLEESTVSEVADATSVASSWMSCPNPFHPGDTIELAADASAARAVVLHDARGRVVRTIELAPVRDGDVRMVRWDGRTDAGAVAPSGMYFASAHLGSTAVTRKLLLLGR